MAYVTHDEPVRVLERWIDYGGHYRVRELWSAGAVVDLCTCHGEPVERLASRDEELIEYLQSHKRAIDQLESEGPMKEVDEYRDPEL